ncbi:hypothetical protein LJC33_02550 [Eubacteriales bacterium OttesenSCG-928-N13]|nr:hypothetical protein [Eubacteriales bacterium OttesenSCG-928-N13]
MDMDNQFHEAWQLLLMKLAVADHQMADGNMTDHKDVIERLKERIQNA